MSGRGTGGSGEDELIARYFRPLARSPGAFGLTDDAAVLPAGAGDLVVTTDALVAGVHFLPDDPPETLARKALRVNLSDLAAKGAVPAGFVLTLALREADDTWLSAFARALGEDAAAFACPLMGGDTVHTDGPLTLSITAFGRVPPGRMVRRAGARAGDIVAVSGTIGDAVAGLHVLKTGAAAPAYAPLVARYRVPEPRVALAGALLDHATAAMDVSDGLVGDLAKLCATSGVTARIEAARVPVSPAAAALLAADPSLTRAALITGGDDYEILCTAGPAAFESLRTKARAAGVTLTAIGRIEEGMAPPRFVDGEGRDMVFARASYSHF
ncbi:MAG: thiamine-phosphate kinase [Xanthobacteraceae bacterium]|nr:MAG: thiamine-phosphate kinase [Xanthobacteraceae bacterium]